VLGKLHVFALTALLVACTQPAATDVTVEAPQQQPAHTTVNLPEAILPDDFRIALELAITPEEIARGLMFRPSLPEDRGMLFVFDDERVPNFWMKNTIVALDLIFLDNSGQVVDIIANAQPCAAEPCPHYIPHYPARAVLEIGAGVAEGHHLKEGDLIRFRLVDGFPVQSAGRVADQE
jgi:uncharacterized membrane protein (UPF0127 family)